MLETYHGGCHCGRVRFRIRADLGTIGECNCSICTKKGILHLPVSRERLQILSGADDLTTYQFNTGTAKHTFCRHCGIHAFYQPRSDPENYSVNARCLDDYDPAKARFRTWLRLGLDRLAGNEAKASQRLKRGGGVAMTSLDFVTAEGEVHEREIADDSDLDAWFQQEFVRALFGRAVDAVERECHDAGRDDHFDLFKACDLADLDAAERPSYKTLAEGRGWTVNDVTNRLAGVRRAFRGHVLRLLRDACASDEEFEAEARSILGQYRRG